MVTCWTRRNINNINYTVCDHSKGQKGVYKKKKKTKRNNKRKTKKLVKKTKKPVKKTKKPVKKTKKPVKKTTSEIVRHIIDPPLSKKESHKGTKASSNIIGYNYQNYKNIAAMIFKLGKEQKKKKKKIIYISSGGIPFIDYNVKLKKIERDIVFMQEEDILNKEGYLIDRYNNVNGRKFIRDDILAGSKKKYKLYPIICNLKLQEGNHANIMLVDLEKKQLELFEPHGSKNNTIYGLEEPGDYKHKKRDLSRFFKKIVPDYKFINVTDYAPKGSFQIGNDPKEHSGYCVTWSLLYFHYRVLNPNVSSKDIVQYMNFFIQDRNISKYARYVEDTLKKNKI